MQLTPSYALLLTVCPLRVFQRQERTVDSLALQSDRLTHGAGLTYRESLSYVTSSSAAPWFPDLSRALAVVLEA